MTIRLVAIAMSHSFCFSNGRCSQTQKIDRNQAIVSTNRCISQFPLILGPAEIGGLPLDIIKTRLVCCLMKLKGTESDRRRTFESAVTSKLLFSSMSQSKKSKTFEKKSSNFKEVASLNTQNHLIKTTTASWGAGRRSRDVRNACLVLVRAIGKDHSPEMNVHRWPAERCRAGWGAPGPSVGPGLHRSAATYSTTGPSSSNGQVPTAWPTSRWKGVTMVPMATLRIWHLTTFWFYTNAASIFSYNFSWI